MKRKIINLFITTFLAFTFFSCNNLIEDQRIDAPVVNSQKGSIFIKLNDSNSRTILATDIPLTEMSYTLKGTKNGGSEITIKSNVSYAVLVGGTILIDTGDWNFTLLAGKEGCDYYSATATKTIATGKNNINFILAEIPSAQNKTGSFSVSLTFPDNAQVATVKAGLFTTAWSAVTGYEMESLNISGGNTVTYAKTEVPSGAYVIQFKFYKADNTEIKPGYSELVQVKDFRNSRAQRTLDDLERYHTITYNLNGGSFIGGIFPSSFNEYQSVTLPMASDITRNGYTFAGWYSNETLTGVAVTEITTGTTVDVMLWAKWEPVIYTITYLDLNGATNPNPITYTVEDEIVLQDPVLDGEYFSAWVLDGNEITKIPLGTFGNIELTAEWGQTIVIDVSELSSDKLDSWLKEQAGNAVCKVVVIGSANIDNLKTIIGILNENNSKYIYLDLSNITGITKIEGSSYSKVFDSVNNLIKVVLPNTLESLTYAFWNCAELRSVVMQNGLKTIGSNAFFGCGLTNVIVPESVTSISVEAFRNCTRLESITFEGIKFSVAKDAFDKCENLKEVYYNGTLKDWCEKVTFIRSYSGEKTNPCSYGATLYLKNGANWEPLPENLIIPNDIEKIGSNSFSGCNLKSVTIPPSVSISEGAFENNIKADLDVILLDGWESVPSFKDCTALKSITIPNTVTTIGDARFWRCNGLKNINIPNNVTTIGKNAFWGSGLTSVTIPESVTEIKEGAFDCCGSLTSVTILGKITSLAKHTFYRCPKLECVILPDSLISIGQEVFCNSCIENIIIPKSVKSIDNLAFYDCKSLNDIYYQGSVDDWTEISFSNFASNPCYNGANLYVKNGGDFEKVTSIEISDDLQSSKYAFCGCKSITNVTIANTVTSIGNYAFYGCSSITSITIPTSVTTIGNYAFYGCSSITSITIPTSVTTIGISAFDTFSSNLSIIFEDGRTTIPSGCFSGCTGLTNVTIPSSVTSIGNSAFSGCTGLTSITIPSSVTSIGNSAFSGCTGLTSITIPNSVTSMGSSAFSDCTKLNKVYYDGSLEDWLSVVFSNYESNPCCNGAELYTENSEKLTNITIPSRITSIGRNVFSGCTGLTSVTIPSSVTLIEIEAFSGCTELVRVTMANSITSIEGDAFSNCTKLNEIYYDGSLEEWMLLEFTTDKSNPCCNGASLYLKDNGTWKELCGDIIIPNITIVKNYVFKGCNKITSITIPICTTSIESSAFFTGASLDIIFATGRTSIPKSALKDCENVVHVTIPNTVKEIGSGAFSGCSDITITMPGSINKTSADKFKQISNLSIIIADAEGVSSIENLFQGNTSLVSIVIPSSITSIGFYQFKGCTLLKNVTMSSGIKNIYSEAFSGCTSLETITLPATLEEIYQAAFYNSGLKSLFIQAEKPPKLGNYVFDSIGSDFKIYVPKGTVVIENQEKVIIDYYNTTDGWRTYGGLIEEMPD